jgi:transcriptional regulator with XRE-family HTH domain
MAEAALGFLLRSLREERGLSLRELGQLAGVDHAYIYRLETGVKEAPSDEVLSKLLRALKPGKREAEMLRYLAAHPKTEVALVAEVLKDSTITYDIFAATAGAAFRGAARPDYAKLIGRVRRILSDENGGG